jgi:hypothetical protein
MMAQEQFAVANSMKTMAGMISADLDDSDEEAAAPARMSMTRAGVLKGRMPMGAPPPAPGAPADEEDFGEAAPSELFGESEPTGVSTRTGGYGAGAPPAPAQPSYAPPKKEAEAAKDAPAPKQSTVMLGAREQTRSSSFTVGSVSPASGKPTLKAPQEPIAPMQAMPPKQKETSRARLFMLLLLLAGIIAALIWGLLR